MRKTYHDIFRRIYDCTYERTSTKRGVIRRMFDALTYQIMLEEINRNAREKGVLNDTIGILITRPELPTGKDILSSLEYYHFRTGKSVNFYLPGCGAYWNSGYPDRNIVTTINNVDWSFSSQMFAQFIEELEKYSKWQYSGESELLLVELKEGILSYETTMQFYLDKMIRDSTIDSVEQFFEDLFRICKHKDTLKQISNTFGVDKAKQVSLDMLLENLPLGLGNLFTQEKYFCVKNMGR